LRDLENPLDIEGVTVLPGVCVDIPIYCLHHNAQVWGDDHMDYKPERFSEENIANMHSHAFLPFSAGPRNCIGQVFALHEVKTLVARIVHRFKLEVDVNHKVEMMPDLILRAKHGIKLKLSLRH